MNRIMFSDKYGLTDAVLVRRKTMTRALFRLLRLIGTDAGQAATV